MSVSAAIQELVNILRGIPDIKSAPNKPTEAADMLPFAVVYEGGGTTELLSAGEAKDLVTLVVEIHISRVLLGISIAKAQAICEAFLRKLIADPTLNSSVSTITSINRTFGGLSYADTTTIGYKFEVGVKIMMSL